jgi:hypothetical protein
MRNPNDQDDELSVADLVDDAVVADTNSPQFTACELHRPWWPRLAPQSSQSIEDPQLEITGETIETTVALTRQPELIHLEPKPLANLVERDPHGIFGQCSVGRPNVIRVFQLLEKCEILGTDDRRDRLAATGDDHPLASIRGAVDKFRKVVPGFGHRN